MTDAIRLNASVSSVGPQPLPTATGLRVIPLVQTSVDATEVARADKPAVNPQAHLAQAQARGVRIGARAPGAAARVKQAQGAPTGNVALVNVSREEAQHAVQESLRAASRLAGQSAVAARNQYKPSQVYKDELGQTHVRMDRIVDGLPVYGEQIVSHLDAQGQVSLISGDTNTAPPVRNTTTTISADEAKAAARAAFGATPKEISAPERVIIKADDGVYPVAYRVRLAALDDPRGPRAESFFVDATHGQVLLSIGEISGFVPEWRLTAGAAAPLLRTVANTDVVPPGTGASLYLGNVPLTTTKSASGKNVTYILKDPSHSNTETRDALNGTPSSSASGFNNARQFTKANNRWGEPTDDARIRAAIDAQYIGVRYLDYLKDMFGRNGIDGRGLVSRSLVHVQKNYVNAYWDGNKMNYGDGDGVNAGPLVDKDVASHEPTHGVTQTTSNLQYRGEPGALNEAMSDIMGSAGFSWWLRGKKDNGILTDFWIGEDCWTPGIDGDALRYMDHPTRDRSGTSEMYSRDNYASRYTGGQDNGGVHLNSGIANNAFYLLAAGGTNDTSHIAVKDGIGIEKAVRIFARANMVYFTPQTTFAQARELTLKAARDLYGDGPEAQRVGEAWAAVGVSG